MIDQLATLTVFRKLLHRNPELSGAEVNTAFSVKEFILKHAEPQLIQDLGGHGLAAIYNYGDDGPTILIRCELDALPIQESNDFEHRSLVDGVSHKCGHDGHMAMVTGLIFWLNEEQFEQGRVVLLFQPAEETGKGAPAVLDDPKFNSIEPDYAFALHNIPGAPMHDIIVLENGFSATVQSFSITLIGKETHAADPASGVNPAIAIANLLTSLEVLNNPQLESEAFCILTPVYINIGDKAYGVSPGTGELHYTVRTWSEVRMREIEVLIKEHVEDISATEQLEYKIAWFEYFPGAKVDPECNQILRRAALKNDFTITEQRHPFKFGEDFGWIARKYKATMFGLGSGLETPALHHADYDFPDELITTGVKMFQEIIREILG